MGSNGTTTDSSKLCYEPYPQLIFEVDSFLALFEGIQPPNLTTWYYLLKVNITRQNCLKSLTTNGDYRIIQYRTYSRVRDMWLCLTLHLVLYISISYQKSSRCRMYSAFPDNNICLKSINNFLSFTSITALNTFSSSTEVELLNTRIMF